MKERLKYSEMALKGVETLAVVTINERNRLAIAFRQVSGSYRPPDRKAAQPA